MQAVENRFELHEIGVVITQITRQVAALIRLLRCQVQEIRKLVVT